MFRIKRPSASTGNKQEQQAAEHGEVSSSVADHAPESLIGSEQLRNLGRGNRGRDNNKEWNSGQPRPQSQQNKQSTDNFKTAYKVGCEIRVCESNSREPYYTYVRIDELENPLCEENQAHGQANQRNACRSPWRLQKKSTHSIHALDRPLASGTLKPRHRITPTCLAYAVKDASGGRQGTGTHIIVFRCRLSIVMNVHLGAWHECALLGKHRGVPAYLEISRKASEGDRKQ